MLTDDADIMEELYALNQTYDMIHYDLEEGIVEIHDVEFPYGWTPTTGTLLFDLPPTYREEQPRVYLEAKMSYYGEKPEIMLMDHVPPAGYDNSKWAEHCIHRFNNWHPQRDTLVTITRMVTDSLEHPNESNPWK